MSELRIINANVFTPSGRSALKGEQMGIIRHIPDAAVVVRDGLIDFVGPMDQLLPAPGSCEVIDAGGHAVLPGFVDSHTHLLFGGYRPDEFEWRVRGDSYMSIMQRGGGIQSTVNATRDESEDSLLEKAKWFIGRMAEMGVTTVEVKTGYGLSTESELKMLDAIGRLQSDPEMPLRVISTFMPAHAVPKEYKDEPAAYVDLIVNEMIPAAKGKATFFDIFTEKNVFELEDSEKLLAAAKKAGFSLKLHADEIVTLGGAELAAKMGAVSADHLLHVSDRGISEMAENGVVATLLPLTAFSLREPYAPARKFIDSGAAVALATDLNPGSCFSGSIPLMIALACIYMDMTPEETLTALTLNGAAALGLAETTGSIEKGKSADLIILHFDSYKYLPYYIGMNCVDTVISRGIPLKK